MSRPCDFVAPIRRSREVKAVCTALRALLERGVIRGFQEGKLRVGRMNIDVEWPDTRVNRLRIDIEAATLTIAPLLETASNVALLRDLKALLRTAQGPAPGREEVLIDPARAMLRLTEQSGAVSLALIVTRGEYEYCARRLIELARQALALVPEHIALAESYQRAAIP